MSRTNNDQDSSRRPDIFELVHGFVTASMEGELTDVEIADFEQLLRDQPQARRLYAEYLETTIGLSRIATVPAELKLPLASASPPEPSPPVSPSRSAAKSPVLGFLGGAMDYVNHSRMLMFWLMAILVGGWFVFQLGSLLMDRSHRGDAPVANRSADPNSPDVSHLPGGSFANSAHPRQNDSVAWMTTVVDCHWRVVSPAVPPASAPAPAVVETGADTVLYKGELFHVGSEFSAGQRLDLVRGLAEITFRSGARVVLNGPAQFTVGSPLEGKLQVGKLTARVPHDAHGFTVNTPAGKVVDLGTEFGVAVAADHTMAVEVFVGEVAVDASSSSSQTPGSPSTTPTPPLKLSAGHAVHVEAGKPVVTIPLDPKRFVRGLGPREDGRVAQAAYLDYVRSLKPVVWFRMEGNPEERVLHDEMGGPDAKLFWDGPGNPFVEGTVGKSLWLRGSKLKDWAIVPGRPRARLGKLTVVAWVRATSFPNNTSVAAACDLTGPVGLGQFFLGIWQKGNGKTVLIAQIAERDGRIPLLGEPDADTFPLNEWQHIALATDGSTLRLYRQGREVASMKHAGLQDPVRESALGIGGRPNDAGSAIDGAHPAYWDGKLDEIAVFNDVLTADDIRKLASAPPQ